MLTHRFLGVLAVAAVLVAGSSRDAEARLFSRLAAKAQDAPQAEPVTALPAPTIAYTTSVATLDPSCCTPAPVCCPTPCIKYRHAGLCKVKCCGPNISTVLSVNNPCTCCPVAIPVCLPCCCTDAPTVSCRKTLLADGAVTYDWCCGVSVTVRFQRCGDVLVTYRGV